MRSFDPNSVLQLLFPDRTIRNGLSNSVAFWTTDPLLSATAGACDAYGNCTTVNSSAGNNSAGNRAQSAETQVNRKARSTQPSFAPGAPQAVIVAPTAGSYVAAGGSINVTVAAEAGAALKEVTISLGNQVVQTLTFTQSENVTQTLRTVNLTGLSQGEHTLTARATDWANATQSMELTLWSQTGSACNADSGVSLRTADGKSYTRRGLFACPARYRWGRADG